MSKFAILKELADLKTLAQRKSLLKRGVVIGGLAYLLMGYGQDAWSYLTTAGRMVASHVQAKVPLEFELQRARTMIDDLIPDVRQNMLVIAQEEVGVENLGKDLEQARKELVDQRDELMRMRKDVESDNVKFRLGSREVTRDELKEELSRRFNRFQLCESTVASKRQLLTAREKSLDAARARLANMINAKRDLEVQVENLQAQLKTQQSETLASSIEIKDSEVSRCQNLLNDVRVRLEVADRLVASHGDFGTMTSYTVTSTDDIGQQIDQYFSKETAGEPLAQSP